MLSSGCTGSWRIPWSKSPPTFEYVDATPPTPPPPRAGPAPLLLASPELLEEEPVVLHAPLRPAEDVQRSHVEHRLEVRVVRRRVRLRGLQGFDPQPFRLHGQLEGLAEATPVERDAGNPGANGRELFELCDNVVHVLLRSLPVPQVRAVEADKLR